MQFLVLNHGFNAAKNLIALLIKLLGYQYQDWNWNHPFFFSQLMDALKCNVLVMKLPTGSISMAMKSL